MSRGRREGAAHKRHACTGDYRGWGPSGHERRERRWSARTKNMKLMSVTPEVSQLEMSSLNIFMLTKSSLMLVMSETHQSATGPY